MVHVSVTVSIQGKVVKAEDVRDSRIKAGLLDMASSLSKTLSPLTCREHQRGVREVRVHMNAKGVADLRYDVCCEQLQAAVTRATT